MMADLLKCPFCGGEAGKLYPSGGVVVSLVPPVPLYGCATCQFGLPTQKRWNARPTPPHADIDRIVELMAEATPGPWYVPGKETPVVVSRDKEHGCWVAECGDRHDLELVPFNMKRWMADTRLIVAMHDYFRALSELDHRPTPPHADTARIRDAVAKLRANLQEEADAHWQQQRAAQRGSSRAWLHHGAHGATGVALEGLEPLEALLSELDHYRAQSGGAGE